MIGQVVGTHRGQGIMLDYSCWVWPSGVGAVQYREYSRAVINHCGDDGDASAVTTLNTQTALLNSEQGAVVHISKVIFKYSPVDHDGNQTKDPQHRLEMMREV